MRRSRVVPHESPTAHTHHEHVRTHRRHPTRLRARHCVAAALIAVVASSTALPAAAADLAALDAVLVPRDAIGPAGTVTAPGDAGVVSPQATIENEEAWCSYLSSYYLAFPSPWSARVINCRHSDLFVAPLFSDGSRGMCVLVPARHSRHLGGNVVRAVVDIRLC